MGVVIAGVGLGESRFWVATDGGDWHESANWSASSGGEGGATVPGSGDVAVFDDNSGDCVLNDDVEVGGLHLTAGFQGRVSQGSAVLAIGDGRFDVAGGEFSGGSENITIDMGATTGGAPLALLGGVFTSSSGRLSILRSSTESEVMVHFSGGTFNHNSGELRFAQSVNSGTARRQTTVIEVPLELHDFTITGGRQSSLEYYFDISDAGKITVTNTFTVKQDVTGRFVLVNGGVIEVTGDLYCGAGSLGGTTQLKLTSAEDQYYEYSGGRFPALVIDKPGGALLPRNCDELYLDRLELLQGTFKAPSVVLDIAPWTFTVCTNLLYTGGVFLHNGATLRFSTLSDSRTRKDRQSIVTHLPLELPNLTLSGGATNTELLYYYFNNGETGGITVTDNLVIEPLTGSHKMQIDGDGVELLGGLAVSDGALGGSCVIKLSGTADQTYTVAGGKLPIVMVDKAAGVVKPANLTTNLDVSVLRLQQGEFQAPTGVLDIYYFDDSQTDIDIFSFTGGSFVHNNGTLRFPHKIGRSYGRTQSLAAELPLMLYNFTIAGGNIGSSKAGYYDVRFKTGEEGSITIVNDFAILPDDERYTIRLMGDEVILWGDLLATVGIDGGTARIVFDGSQQQHYTTHGGRLPHLVIENMNGVVPLNTTNMAVSVFELNGGEFVAPSGVLDVTYHDYAAANNLIIKSGNFIHNNGTVSFMVEAESNSSFAQTAIIEHPLLLNKFLVSGGNAGGSKTHPNLHYNFNINSNGLLAVARELRIESSDPERKVAVNGGEIETWGDVVFGTGANGGSVAIVLSGANVQNISQVEGVAPTGEWRVDKNGGRVVLATDLTLVGGSQDMVWESGVIDLSTNRLVVGRDLLSGSGEQRLAVMMADELVAGCLMIGRNAESLEGVVLEMDGPDKGREPLLGQSYTVVSTGNPLESELESVMWHNPWRGKVDYSENEGRDVVVYGIWLVHTGTVVVVR